MLGVILAAGSLFGRSEGVLLINLPQCGLFTFTITSAYYLWARFLFFQVLNRGADARN